MGSSRGVGAAPGTAMAGAEATAGEQLSRQHAGVQVLAGRLGQRTTKFQGNGETMMDEGILWTTKPLMGNAESETTK